MGRRVGSGKFGRVTTHIERLAAEVFAQDVQAMTLSNLDTSLTERKSSLSAESLLASFSEIASRAGLKVSGAASPDPDRISDIRLEMGDGTIVRVEVKAQTTRGRNQLGSADWTHDITDTLRWLYLNDGEFRRRMPPWMQEGLDIADASSYFDGWDLGSLWACDIARLRDPKRRERAGVKDPSDLNEFVGRFYLLHVTRVGARLIPLGAVEAIRSAMDDREITYEVSSGPKSSAVVTVRPRVGSLAGSPGFVYYVGYPSGVKGRHKLHGWVFDDAPGIIEVQHGSTTT